MRFAINRTLSYSMNMNQKKVFLLIGGITLLVTASFIILFLRKDVTKENQEPAITGIKTFPCPLSEDNCRYLQEFTSRDKGYEYNKLGFHSTATNSSVLAVFEGDVIVNERKLHNEKTVVVLSTDGQTAAEYKFLGVLPTRLPKKVKTGDALGIINTRFSYYNDKYNFVFSIYDLKEKKYVKLNFNKTPGGGYSITKK